MLSKKNHRFTAARLAMGASLLAMAVVPDAALAQTLPAFTSQPMAGGGQKWSLSMETLLLLSSMTFIPAILLMMSAFTRIIIVLSLLRTALGTQSTPPNQVLLGLALFMTFFVMSPVLTKVHETAWQPLSREEINVEQFGERAIVPVREFMLAQTRETTLGFFAELAQINELEGPEQVPLRVLAPAFVVSEITTAFQIGFTIFIPFLIIDLVVASVLMALGMMMVPPATISLPFKLMLFVLMDGWVILLGSLAQSFHL